MRILNKHGLVVFFLIAAAMAVFSPVSHGAASEILTGPYLQAVTIESIQILVETTSQDPVTVEYGETASYGEKARTQSIEPTETTPATYVHDIKLTGLQPNTRYHYRIVQTGKEGADYTFNTGVSSGTSFRFAFAADFRTGIGVHDAIATRLKDANPRFLLYGGDLCADSTYQSFKSEFFRPNELALISGTAFFNAPGNHEGWKQNTKAFTQAPESKSGTQDYYSFDYGDLHVLVLNNEFPLWEDSNQYKFAQQDLARTTKTWKIVAAHRPAYCAGGHGEDADMKNLTMKIFEPNKVSMVLGGHSHFYQHNLVNGIHHMVIGAAGAPLYNPSTAAYTIQSIRDYNFAVVDVTPGTLHMVVYNDKGTVLETIDLIKGVTPQFTPVQSPKPVPTPAPTPAPTSPATGQIPSVPAIQVDLSPYYNQDAFSYDKNAGDGKYDNPPDLMFSCYSADLVKADPVFEGVGYKYGPMTDGVNNAVKCEGQTIKLPAGQYQSLRFLGAATQGDQAGTFVISYTDGTSTEVKLAQVDWCSSYTVTEKIVQTMDHRHREGVDEVIYTHVFAYYLTPAAGKTVTGLALPKNVDIHLLALSLVPMAGQAPPAAAAASAAPAKDAPALIARASVWKYFDQGQDLGTAWRDPSFDDSKWASGPAVLGYGGKGEVTVVGYGSDAAHKYPTTYFRKSFVVSDPSFDKPLMLRISRDDGAIVYLNGKPVCLTNMPSGITADNVKFTTLVPDCGNDFSFKSYDVDPKLLVKGTNVIAVEVHQTSASSSDLIFDLELTVLAPAPAAAPAVLVARRSEWKYFAKGQDLGKAWRVTTFDDSAWATGKAPLGYGGKGETTAVSFGADAAHKYPTTYLRKTFTVTDPSAYRELTLQIARDDGALVYLNGRLVAVTSMPPGTTGENIAYNTLALDCGNDFSFKSFKIDPAWLVKGPNVLAVEVHQASASSSDLFFDLELAEPGPALAAAPGPAEAKPAPAPAVLVVRHSDWKYFAKGQDLGKAWRESAFDDSAWATGKAPLGYGGKGETTAVSFGADAAHKYPTTYFRKTFTVTDPSAYRELALQIARDDGALVYLNGRLVAVTSMPPGTTGENVAYNTLALDCGNDFSFKAFKIDPAWLVKGPNVLAVEIHQASASSSDLFFDLELAEPGPALAAAPGPAPAAAAAPTRDYTGALRFVVAADCQGTDDGYLKGTDDGTAGPRTEQLLKRIKELNPQPAFMLLAGDLIAGPNDAGRPITDVVPQYEALRKHLTSVYPIGFFYPGIGNHQVKGKLEGEDLFGKAFPEFKAEGFTEKYGRTVYYFDRGETRFFMLNTNHPGEEHRIADEQFKWLEKNIDPTKKHHIFIMHEPAYGTWHNCQVNQNQKPDTLDGYPAERDRFWNLVDKSNGPMVFVGHQHMYTRRHIDGNFGANGFTFTQTVYQITTGGFGGGTNGGAQDTRQVDVMPIGIWHFTVVDIKGDFVHVQAIEINGRVIDEFEQVQRPVVPAASPMPTGESAPVKQVHLSWQQNDTAGTMTVTWTTTAKSESIVQYGPTPAHGSQKAGGSVYSNALGLYVHTVELDSLTPDTVYHYACGSAAGGWSGDRTFVTAPLKGAKTPLTIGVWADTQDDPGENATFAVTGRMIPKMLGFNPRFTIHAGDLVVNGSYKNSWLNLLAVAEPLNAVAPLMPTPGNHDNLGDQALPSYYYDLFNLPEKEQWYSFDYGNVHFVSLHTGRPNDVPENKLLFAPGTPQYEWLKNDLKQAGQDPAIKWKIVYMHYPPYAVGVSQSAAVLKHLAPLFDEFRVDLVITGHRHAYEAMKSTRGQAVVDNGPNFSGARGTVYAIVGPAGGNPAGGGSTSYTAYSEVGYAFGILRIDGNRLTYEAYHEDGKVFDQWTITKM